MPLMAVTLSSHLLERWVIFWNKSIGFLKDNIILWCGVFFFFIPLTLDWKASYAIQKLCKKIMNKEKFTFRKYPNIIVKTYCLILDLFGLTTCVLSRIKALRNFHFGKLLQVVNGEVELYHALNQTFPLIQKSRLFCSFIIPS